MKENGVSNMREFESFERIGTMPHRSYYIPFDEKDKVKTKYGIVDRNSSSRFISLNGKWNIKQHNNVNDVVLNEELTEMIPVPACVQLHGYDQIQYLNSRYPFPIMLPHIPYNNPCWHYRREFNVSKKSDRKYYINFEGVDSAFYLYINGTKKGYSQISHATSEFDITDLLVDGTNTIDVVVLKWCLSTYLECQDKFRFSGIFRDVYILERPQKHITDYKIETALEGNNGILSFKNESEVEISLETEGQKVVAAPGETVTITVENVKTWTVENPNLYSLLISANDELIYEKVGFRTVTIDGHIFKINGKAIKLKGVNRHDFNCKTGATVSLANLMEDITLMKELNVNAVRTSHYPNSPEFYQLCDEHGLYIMDEADLEMHGSTGIKGGYDFDTWKEYAENTIFEPGITDRHIALVERDKNRPSVIIWSLGNESSFGAAFIPGAKYVKNRDNTRPVHYENLQFADEKYYFTDLVDMVSMMYPSLDKIKEDVLDNPKETRPFVLCEYTHAMGNSCGDIADYWELIYNNDQMMGGFVWEWADHGIKTRKGFLYGGDFGETEHDGNFCIDGLLTPDRKFKTSAYEMKAVYGGKTKSPVEKQASLPQPKGTAEKIEISVNENTGEITSVLVDKKEVLVTPIGFNITRYTDNDRPIISKWEETYHLSSCKPYVISCKKTDNRYELDGVVAANCIIPAIEFKAIYEVVGNELDITVSYKVADYVNNLPRVGLEFAVSKANDKFAYIGYGPTESYIDKHIAAEYGYYESTAKENYDRKYVRPQESGSHYASEYLRINDLFEMVADKPFSFSVNPYTTKQLRETKHDFELKENDFTNVCIDLAMRGVGSHSCGPELEEKYEIPREFKNTFKLIF